jgi:hypothetical protein
MRLELLREADTRKGKRAIMDKTMAMAHWVSLL